MIRAEFVIDGRRQGHIEVHNIGPSQVQGNAHYSWLVDFGGQSRRGTCAHRVDDGAMALLHTALGRYLAGAE